jgi:YfiR/HmsC-like
VALLKAPAGRRWVAIAAIWTAVLAVGAPPSGLAVGARASGLAAGLAVPAAEQRTATAEDDIKAAFLFNFTQFVEWPPAADTQEPFRICVVADASFGAALDRIVAGESVGNRPIARMDPASPDAARGCQILFIGRQDDERTVERWLAAVRGLPVLVVGESGIAWSHGVHVNFVIEHNRVKFDVNNDNAVRAGLTISSKLLRVARNVTRSAS